VGTRGQYVTQSSGATVEGVKKLNTEDTPTINTHKNIVKNMLHDVFASKGRFEEVDVNLLRADQDSLTVFLGLGLLLLHVELVKLLHY
jgi:hypothetical protein